MLAVFLGLIVVGTVLFPPEAGLVPYLAYMLVVVAQFVGVCWLKGEPPRWRWGNDRRLVRLTLVRVVDRPASASRSPKTKVEAPPLQPEMPLVAPLTEADLQEIDGEMCVRRPDR